MGHWRQVTHSERERRTTVTSNRDHPVASKNSARLAVPLLPHSVHRERSTMMTNIRFVLRLVVFSAVAFLATKAQRPLRLDLPLNQESFVFVHNAATGYLEEASPLEDPLVGFAKNQDGTFTDQLNCGGRAFDLEPAEINGNIMFRHSDREVTEISFQDGVQEMLDWSMLDTSQGELILLKIGECEDGASCDAGVATILQNLGVEFIEDCNEFATLTVGQALERGPVLALKASCFVQNFDESLQCHGFLPDNDPANVAAVRACVPEGFNFANTDNIFESINDIFQCLQGTLTVDLVNLFDCWLDSGSNEFPTTQLFDHLNAVAAAGPPQDGRPWQWQALWQVGPDSILLSIFRPVPLPSILLGLQVTNILNDVEESEINRQVLELVTSLVNDGVTLNLVEVDDVCDTYGRQLLTALRPEGDVGQSPTASPSVGPTFMPTSEPSTSPSSSMTPTLSEAPSLSPSESFAPSLSVAPSVLPSVSLLPSLTPSASPSTSSPSSAPSGTTTMPSASPTTPVPSPPPTFDPTAAPTPMPTTATPQPSSSGNRFLLSALILGMQGAFFFSCW